MSEESTISPLTPEEEAQLAWLQYRQAMANWRADDDARLAELAELAPVIAALGDAAAIDQLVAELDATKPDLSEGNAQRVGRLVQILRFDGGALVKRHEQLSTPAPQPETPDVPEPSLAE